MDDNNNNNSKIKLPSIDTLQREKFIKENSKFEIYNIVLNKCIEKIVYTNRHTDKTFVIFEVPKILIGYPGYDMKSCILYLMGKLSEGGYLVKYIEPFYLYIDWGSSTKSRNNMSNATLQRIPGENPKRLKEQTKNLLQLFPNTSKVEYVYEDANVKKKRGKKKK